MRILVWLFVGLALAVGPGHAATRFLSPVYFGASLTNPNVTLIDTTHVIITTEVTWNIGTTKSTDFQLLLQLNHVTTPSSAPTWPTVSTPCALLSADYDTGSVFDSRWPLTGTFNLTMLQQQCGYQLTALSCASPGLPNAIAQQCLALPSNATVLGLQGNLHLWTQSVGKLSTDTIIDEYHLYSAQLTFYFPSVNSSSSFTPYTLVSAQGGDIGVVTASSTPSILQPCFYNSTTDGNVTVTLASVVCFDQTVSWANLTLSLYDLTADRDIRIYACPGSALSSSCVRINGDAPASGTLTLGYSQDGTLHTSPVLLQLSQSMPRLYFWTEIDRIDSIGFCTNVPCDLSIVSTLTLTPDVLATFARRRLLQDSTGETVPPITSTASFRVTVSSASTHAPTLMMLLCLIASALSMRF